MNPIPPLAVAVISTAAIGAVAATASSFRPVPSRIVHEVNVRVVVDGSVEVRTPDLGEFKPGDVIPSDITVRVPVTAPSSVAVPVDVAAPTHFTHEEAGR